MDYVDIIAEALLLIESGDTMFHLGPTQNMELGEYHKNHNIIDHKEYDLDHGAGGN
jgi:hypothetical protein